MKIDTITTRTVRIPGEKFWFEAISSQEGTKWFNCLYIKYVKEDFPDLKHAPVIDCDWSWMNGKRFDYNEAAIAKLDWHCGITFYEETFLPLHNKTIVKAGCDYQHLYDTMDADIGIKILMLEVPALSQQFKNLVAGVEADA